MPNAMLQSLLTTSKYIINSEMGTRGCKQGKFWSLWFSWFYLVWIFIFCLLAFIWRIDLSGRNPIFANTFGTAPYSPRGDRSNWTEFGVNPQLVNDVLGVLLYVILVVQNLTPNVLVWAFVQFRPVWFFGVGTSPPDGLPLNKHQWREAVPKKKNTPEKEETCMSFVRTKKQHIFAEISCELNVHAQVIPNCLNFDFKLCI